jgi:uncharacterized membrane protein (UPF0127 family)
MMIVRGFAAAIAAAVMLASPVSGEAVPATWQAPTIALTIETRAGPRQFKVEVARSVEEQERGLMFRTNIPADGGMLFTPYPPEGGPPREARFWMHNTPSALDIVFIRADGTIAYIAANAAAYSEVTLSSGEPVSAVLEINAGRAAALGIAAGDKVSWAGSRR